MSSLPGSRQACTALSPEPPGTSHSLSAVIHHHCNLYRKKTITIYRDGPVSVSELVYLAILAKFVGLSTNTPSWECGSIINYKLSFTVPLCFVLTTHLGLIYCHIPFNELNVQFRIILCATQLVHCRLCMWHDLGFRSIENII